MTFDRSISPCRPSAASPRLAWFVAIGALLGLPGLAAGSIVHYVNKAEWLADAGTVTTITFTEIPGPAILTDQYAWAGVIFPQGNDVTVNSFGLSPTDGWGLMGGMGFPPPNTIMMQFDAPRHSIGIEYPASAQFDLYLGDVLVGQSMNFFGPTFESNFAGIISMTAFDRVEVIQPLSGISFIDNLYFGAPIPAAPGMALLGLASWCGGTRRRRTGESRQTQTRQ